MMVMHENFLGHGVSIYNEAFDEKSAGLLNDQVVAVLSQLHRRLSAERVELISARLERQKMFDQGKLSGYASYASEATSSSLSTEIQNSQWKVIPLPEDMLLRRVEVVIPAHASKRIKRAFFRGKDKGPKMGHWVVLDLEDSLRPLWKNIMGGIHNIVAAASSENGLQGGLSVRVRGLHLLESNVRVDGEKISAGLFDLVVCAYHISQVLLAKNKTPHFVIPKCEHHLEAKWWDRLVTLLEENLDLPLGAIKITWGVETYPAAFQMEEILFAGRLHVAGMRVGHGNRVVGDPKVFHNQPGKILPDRTSPDFQESLPEDFLKALVNTCHLRGVLCVAEGPALVPGHHFEQRQNQKDYLKEKCLQFHRLGFDGVSIVHPFFMGQVLSIFTEPHQMAVLWPSAPDQTPFEFHWQGPKTLQGLREAIRGAITFQHAWNLGLSCIARGDSLEDLSTLEHFRAQIWQWIRHGVILDSGERVTKELVYRYFQEELMAIIEEIPKNPRLTKGRQEERISQLGEACEEVREIFLREHWVDYCFHSSDLA